MSEITSRLSTALADRYRIDRRLGEGGMATVYLAEDVKHDRKVALKVLKSELAVVLGADRFVQEIKTTASLQHPHILPLFDSGEAGGFLYYVMPYIEGETLRAKLDRETQLPIEEAVRITSEVADALDYAHRHGVIHRDIKPENILLHDGRPMVADFGIALAVSAAAGGRMTETGLSLGTPHYMSPEQATADKELTSRSDIYSLGSVLYEMLTGEPPHTGSSAQQIIMKIVTEDVAPVTRARKTVPLNVSSAVAKALEKVPADRFETAAAFAAVLGDPTFTVPSMAGVRVSDGHTDWRQRHAGALVVVAAVAAIAAVWGWTRPRARPPAQVVQYRMQIADAQTLAGSGARIAVAPDGSRLVYVGSGESENQLWVRRRDQLQATPLPGTNGASAPFFSPDGSRVAFYVSGSTWRVTPLDGGPTITIADSGAGNAGGTWGRDGYLYFDGELLPANGLVRVPEDGGPVELVTEAALDQGEYSHIWPDALPSGNGVVFTVRRGGQTNFQEWDIAVTDVSSGTYTVLVRGVQARYATSGHLVYVTADGTLMALPFDETTLELTGDAVALREGVRIGNLGATDLALSVAGTLFYTTGGIVGGELGEPVWVTRDGVVSVVDSAWTGNLSDPALSPDGRHLAVSVTSGGETQIWIKQLDRGPLAKLTFGGTRNHTPAWSPDGGTVVFSSDIGGTSDDVYSRRADASAPVQEVLNEEESIHDVTYSADGEWLVYQQTNAGDLFAVRVNDSVPIPLATTEFVELAPAVSPDGRWLAYVTSEAGPYQIYVVPFPNTNEGKWVIATGAEPVWSNNGRELFYRDGPQMEVLEVLPGATFIMGERRALFPVQEYRFSPRRAQYDVTPDGQRFVMIRNRVSDDRPSDGGIVVVDNFFEELRSRGQE